MNKLKIIHWNCFKMTVSRLFDLEYFLDKNNPDIMSLNELKFNETQANLYLRFPNFSVYYKPRKINPELGGGVAL